MASEDVWDNDSSLNWRKLCVSQLNLKTHFFEKDHVAYLFLAHFWHSVLTSFSNKAFDRVELLHILYLLFYHSCSCTRYYHHGDRLQKNSHTPFMQFHKIFKQVGQCRSVKMAMHYIKFNSFHCRTYVIAEIWTCIKFVNGEKMPISIWEKTTEFS